MKLNLSGLRFEDRLKKIPCRLLLFSCMADDLKVFGQGINVMAADGMQAMLAPQAHLLSWPLVNSFNALHQDGEI